ncbi:MAG: hypothetical protein ACQEQC_04620 [Elusimicrobiota bacterium]
MPRVKISGITNKKDARWAALLGVEYISVIMIKGNEKKVSLSKAREIKELLPAYTKFIAEYNNENIEKDEIEKLNPDYIQINGINEPAVKSYLNENDIQLILELNFKKPKIPENTDAELFLTRIDEEVDDLELENMSENLNMKNTIVEGDVELDLIKKYSKKLKPRAWGIKNVINKSPRRIDYKKMKNFNREISLI